MPRTIPTKLPVIFTHSSIPLKPITFLKITICIFTARKRSLGKVIFSEACVKNYVHGGGGGGGLSRTACIAGGIPACLVGIQGRGVVSQHPLQMVSQHALHGRGEGVVSRPTPGGGCIPACTEAYSPAPWTATAAGGTHPTGMHSCNLFTFLQRNAVVMWPFRK